MMAYVISEVEVLDKENFDKYRQLAAASIAEYDGRYLVRGADADVVEGDATKRKMVIVEFPTMDRLREWYASPSYAKALRYRGAGLERRLIFVQGIVSA